MSQYIQRQCRGFAFLLLALGLASPGQASNLIDLPSLLFFTKDERAGIQLPTPEPRCCDVPFPFIFNPDDPEPPTGRIVAGGGEDPELFARPASTESKYQWPACKSQSPTYENPRSLARKRMGEGGFYSELGR